MRAKITTTRTIEIPNCQDSEGTTPGQILDNMISDLGGPSEELLDSVTFEFTEEEIRNARKSIERKRRR